MGLQRGTWRVRVETSSTMSADAHHFYVTNLVEAYEDNTRIFAKCTDARMPRNLV
jgi:hypothetical protein